MDEFQDGEIRRRVVLIKPHASDELLSKNRAENRLMVTRPVRERSLEEIDKPANRSWRLFQLAFILLSIPSMANPEHGDRTDQFWICSFFGAR